MIKTVFAPLAVPQLGLQKVLLAKVSMHLLNKE
jgi:hypothetical protein